MYWPAAQESLAHLEMFIRSRRVGVFLSVIDDQRFTVRQAWTNKQTCDHKVWNIDVYVESQGHTDLSGRALLVFLT